MRAETSKLLNGVQAIVELCIAAGYVLSLIPFVYLWTSGWVIPCIFISMVLGIVNRNGTVTFTAVNLVMGLLGFIPALGYIPRIIGIIISIVTILAMRRSPRY